MDAEGEMDAGDDQAPVEVDDDVSLKEVVAAELSNVNGKWKVNEQGTVGVGVLSVGAELNIQESVSISTGDYSHIEDHEMSVVLMNGSLDNSVSGQSFGSLGEESSLTKQTSELGALDRYVMECSPGRDEFVVNEVDCLKNEPLEVFEAANEFGFQQRAENEESEFENFVREEETFEASQAPGATGYSAEGEGLHFQQLLADSEAEDNSNLLQYSRVDVTEAGGSSVVSLEAEVGLFYGQVFEGRGREDPSHQPLELHCSQILEEGQAVDTSDYAVEGEGGSQFVAGIASSLNRSSLCSIERDNGPNSEEPVGKPHNILVSAVRTAQGEEPNPYNSSNPAGDLAPSCAEEVALVSEENIDHRITSQEVTGRGADPANTPIHFISRGQDVAEAHSVQISIAPSASSCEEVGERVQATGAFPGAERDLAGESSHLRDEVEAMNFVNCPIGRDVGALGQTGKDAPQLSLLNVGSVSSLDNGATKETDSIKQTPQFPPHRIVQSCRELDKGDYYPPGRKQPNNEQQGTSSKVATNRDVLTEDYGALAKNSISASLKPEVDETATVVLEQREIGLSDAAVMTHDSSLVLLLGQAKVGHELVATDTRSLNNVFCEDEPMGGAIVQHELEASEQPLLRHAEPNAENCDAGTGAEIQRILPRFVENSEQLARIFDSANGSGTIPEEYSLGGLKEKMSKCHVNKETSEDVHNVDISPQLCDGTLDKEPVPANFEAPSSSGDELATDAYQRPIDSNCAETMTSVCMEPSSKQPPGAVREDFKSTQSLGKEFDARRDTFVGAHAREVRDEIQPVGKSLLEVQNIQALLPSGAGRRDVHNVSSNFMSLVNVGQLGIVAESAVQTTEAFNSAERGAMPVMEVKVQRSQDEQLLIQASWDDNDLLKKVKTSESVSGTQQIKLVAESTESPGTRKGRDDVKSKSPQRETVGVPLWVKWRGKWQPGIQCSTIDCPPATLKAKPSYSKKHYIVVYSPTARNYSWVDVQHTCPITENPLPLFSGTHDGGRDTVKDVFITRRRMLLKLGGEMLDISDRLHVKAVVESSRNVNVWKSFATEAAAATTYAQLGTLLVSLHLAIVREFIKPTWMTKRYGLWKEECVRAESAAIVQKLTKELINAVLWDDVGPLWNEPDQPELDPQWSNWKGEAFEEKEEPDIEAEAKSAGPSEKDGAQLKTLGGLGGSKRFKEQARARRRRPQSPEASESTPLKRSKHNPDSSEGAIVAFRSPLVHPSGLLQVQPYVPVLEADRCHEVLSGDTLASLNGQVAPSNNETFNQSLGSGDGSLQLASSSVSYHSDGSEGDESKVFERIGKSAAASMAEGLIALESGLCSAYLKNKGRRCNRFSKKEGVRYCEKHIYLIDPEGVGKKFGPEGNMASQSGLCSAFLRRENRRCARQAKDGFKGYCGFHVHLSTSDNDRNVVTDALKGEDGGFSHSNSSSVKDDRCQGITTRGVQCTHRTKDGSSFCVKHSLKGASMVERDENKGQSSGASKMDWQKGTEPGVSPGTQGLAGEVDAHRDVSSEPGSRDGTMRTLELKSWDHSRGSEGSTRKRKALSSFFTDRAVGDPRSSAPPSQEALSPKYIDGKATQWTQCKGRTTRNEEQCSFRAREGQEYCSKHLNAVEGKKKITFQRSVRKDEVMYPETTNFGARNLLHRFIKGVGGIWQSSGSDAGNQLVQSTRLEAARDGTADELVKLVTVEMTKLQMFLHPLDAVEGQKADVSLGPRFVGSSSHSLPVVSEGPDSSREPSIRASLVVDEHKILDDRPVTCGLCNVELPAEPDLGRHWQLVHKKEVSLFVKGHACRVCDRLYTRKQTVMTHWKKRHQSVEMTNPDLSVCFACDLRYSDDDGLLEHVITVHPYQLSSPSLKEMIAQNRAIISAEPEGTETLKCSGCSEEFDTDAGLYQHCENVHRRSDNEGNGVKLSNPGDIKSGESPESGSQSGKYVCRLCGMTFPMLPDLGRHHQAMHMSCNKVGPVRGAAPSKKEAGCEAGRMKLPIRRKADDKAAASEASYGPTRRKRKKLRFTSQRKSYERDTRGPDSLRFHVQAVLQGATLRKRHKKQLDDLASEPTRKDPSPLTQTDFILPHEGLSNPNGSSSKAGILSLARTGPTSLSLTRRVESNIESVQEKFKLQADRIFTEFSQLHGETSVKHESQVDGRSSPIDSEKPWNAMKGCFKQEHDQEDPKDLKCERSKSPLFYSSSSLEQLTTAERRRPNFIVTCGDLSGGQEPVPIVCVIDQDVLLQLRSLSNKESGGKDVYQPSSFTYITKRRLDPSLGLFPENYKIGCTCGKAQCTPDMCEHVNLFDCDNAEACDIYGKPMRGRFPYDDQGSIILEEGYLVYECNSSCQCQQTCQNRVLQKGVTVKLEVFKTQHKGWAVRAAEKIIQGTFVCEYVGEVLHDQEANKRGERYDQVGCSYLYDIDAHLDITGTGRRSKPFVIDATSQGNVARFINHSCAPNLVNYQVLVESMDAQLAHIGLFASRDIEIGEELAYDYRYRLLPGKGCPCHCGAKNCRGRLY